MRDDENESLIDCMDLVAELRGGENYKKFIRQVLKPAYGVGKWKSRVALEKFSDYVLPSFEAFVLLSYENYYEYYNNKCDLDQEGLMMKQFKYTKDARLGGKNKGWSKEGIERYNELHKRIVDDRKPNESFDEDFLEEERQFLGKRKRAKSSHDEDVGLIMATNDLDNVTDVLAL